MSSKPKDHHGATWGVQVKAIGFSKAEHTAECVPFLVGLTTARQCGKTYLIYGE
jgi:hypothetical protein